ASLDDGGRDGRRSRARRNHAGATDPRHAVCRFPRRVPRCRAVLTGDRRHLSGALAAITAAVVGVILNLSVWFALHVLFGQVTEKHVGWLRWFAFDPLALDLKATALALIAAVLAFGLHRGLIGVVGVMAALG